WQSSQIWRIPVVGSLYHHGIHDVSNRFGYGFWDIGSPSDVTGVIPSPSIADKSPSLSPRAAESIKAMSSARQSALDAQAAYADETTAWKNMKVDLTAHGFDTLLHYTPLASVGILANTVQAYNEVQSFHNYPLSWNNLMAKTVSTLNNASIALNGAFLSAQEQADLLHVMGADDQSYHGAATQAWGEWASFVTEANAWASGPNAAGLQPYQSVIFDANGAGLNTTGGHYAQTYRVLRHVEYLCNNPADPMQFDDSGQVWLTVNDMLSDDDNSLWSRAWAMQGRLQTAANQMTWEMQDNQTAASSQIKQANSVMDELSRAGWRDDLSEAPLSAYNASAQAQAAPYYGTFSETQQRASYMLD
ncbi:MAG TPA: hypothetical protein PLO51_05960, partial [Candidatus Micrarchaeota archaeon]|nr:hypothetical protein [Candidatus Micrarchaeota archaeon]